jgi:hypothetical protein
MVDADVKHRTKPTACNPEIYSTLACEDQDIKPQWVLEVRGMQYHNGPWHSDVREHNPMIQVHVWKPNEPHAAEITL